MELSPFVQKMIATAAAVGIYVIGHKIPELKDVLYPLAGGVGLGVWVPRPGDVKADK